MASGANVCSLLVLIAVMKRLEFRLSAVWRLSALLPPFWWRGMLLPISSYLGHRMTEHGLNPVHLFSESFCFPFSQLSCPLTIKGSHSHLFLLLSCSPFFSVVLCILLNSSKRDWEMLFPADHENSQVMFEGGKSLFFFFCIDIFVTIKHIFSNSQVPSVCTIIIK